MISEGSRDTEDWSNDFWKFSFALEKIKFYNIFFSIKSVIFFCHIAKIVKYNWAI